MIRLICFHFENNVPINISKYLGIHISFLIPITCIWYILTHIHSKWHTPNALLLWQAIVPFLTLTILDMRSTWFHVNTFASLWFAKLLPHLESWSWTQQRVVRPKPFFFNNSHWRCFETFLPSTSCLYFHFNWQKVKSILIY